MTIAFAIGMALVIALAGTFVYLRVAADLDEAIDDALHVRADELTRALSDARLEEVDLGDPRAEEAEDTLAQVVRPDGTVLASSEIGGSKSIVGTAELAEAHSGAVLFEPRRVPGVEGEARLLGQPAENRRGRVVLIVGASLGDRDETLSGLLAAFALGGPIALLIASALGYGLATLALGPVEAMRRRAEEITLATDRERLPLPASDDEINRLGRTLNEMLDRIEGSLERERAFVADASHELRTPLALLRAELELGSRPDRDLEEARAAMSSAIEEADRLGRLADDLLELARSDGGRLLIERHEVAVRRLLERTRARFAARATDEARAISVDADGELTASLDPARVEAAMSNLLDNALRHGAGEVWLAARTDGEAVVFEVSDRGSGFPSAFIPEAFDRFTRAESGRTSAGSGLGLAIVRAIAQAHGGDVSIAATGSRTTVAIRIPQDEGRTMPR